MRLDRWVQEGGALTRDEARAEELLRELQAERPIKREPVRTSFDRVFPGMPPAVKLRA